MDRIEAARLLRKEMTRYAGRPYGELARLIRDIDAYEVRGADGVDYQVEVNADRSGEPGSPIMVMAGIDDGSLRGAFSPVTDSFIKQPDGTVEMAPAASD